MGARRHAHCNRGANGIDGVISTALGRLLGRRAGTSPGFVLIGDLAFVHDSNALVGARPAARSTCGSWSSTTTAAGSSRSCPKSTLLEHDRFEQLFGTPLGADILALATAHGLATATATTADELVAQLAQPGPWVCRVPSDRAANVRVHQALNDAVASDSSER